VISHVTRGRTTTYEYVFKIGQVQLYGDNSSCHTALSSNGCKVGAPVLVYYAHLPVLETRLQEFGEAGRDKLLTCIWMISSGFLMIALFFVFKRTGGSDESEDTHENLSEAPDDLHIVPKK